MTALDREDCSVYSKEKGGRGMESCDRSKTVKKEEKKEKKKEEREWARDDGGIKEQN